jgi:leader peptidase (prepilin peptidase) / N-methyltransferase
MAPMPLWLTHLMSVVFGLIFGSLTNVLVARIPKGQSVNSPRSHCPKCKAPIRWWDNIPVLSYLALGGKCRDCRAPISVRYPVIELLVALLFLTARVRFGWNPLLFLRDWPFIVLLVAITFIDLEHRIIPDVLSLGGLVLGLVTAWFVPGLGLVQALAGAAIGFSVFYGLAWAYQALTGRSGLGGGDIKLLAMLGSFVGPQGVLGTIFVSSVAGSVIGVAWAKLTRQKEMMTAAIPFGPFLVLGGLWYYLVGDLIWFQFMTPM